MHFLCVLVLANGSPRLRIASVHRYAKQPWIVVSPVFASLGDIYRTRRGKSPPFTTCSMTTVVVRAEIIFEYVHAYMCRLTLVVNPFDVVWAHSNRESLRRFRKSLLRYCKLPQTSRTLPAARPPESWGNGRAHTSSTVYVVQCICP